MKWNRWRHGVLAAFGGGMAGAIESGLALMVLDPEKFNLNAGLCRTILTIFTLGILTGIKVAAAYLRQSPLPVEDDEPSPPKAGETTKNQ